MGLFGNQKSAELEQLRLDLSALQLQVAALTYSKRVMAPRLKGTPESFFAALGHSVGGIVRTDTVTIFDVGDVMRVRVDAIADTIGLEPLRFTAEETPPITLRLNNSGAGDYSPENAAMIWRAFITYRDGPAPDSDGLAAAFNGHLSAAGAS